MADTSSSSEFQVDAMLCDSCVVAEGKLYIQGGGWHMVTPTSFPFRMSRIGLAILLQVPYTATNQNHTLTVEFSGEDGTPIPFTQQPNAPAGASAQVAELTAQFNVGRPPIIKPGDSQSMPMALNIDQPELPGPGSYSFVLSVDGTPLERLSFRVVDNAMGMQIRPAS